MLIISIKRTKNDLAVIDEELNQLINKTRTDESRPLHHKNFACQQCEIVNEKFQMENCAIKSLVAPPTVVSLNRSRIPSSYRQ